MTHKTRILYIEDDPLFVDMIQDFLIEPHDDIEMTHYESVEEAEDSKQCALTYDCILCDYNLPGMSGIEFLEIIRQHSETTPFIILTGQGDESVITNAFNKGATDYFEKQNNPQHFKLLYHRIINYTEMMETRIDNTNIFSDLADEVDEMLYVADAEFNILFWNKKVEEALDQEINRKDDIRQLNNTDEERLEYLAEKLLNKEEVKLVVEYEKGGETIPFEHRLTPVTDENNEIKWVVGVGRNIKEQREYEQNLRYYNSLIQNVIKDMPQGVIIEDGEEVLFSNDKIFDMFQLDNSINFTNTVDTFDTIKENLKEKIELSDFTEQEESEIIEREVETIYGKKIKIVFNRNNETNTWLFIDITEYIEREEKLREKNEKLEQLTSILSHDIRNPLNVIQARLQMIDEQFDTKHTESAIESTERIENLVNDVLTLAKTEQEKDKDKSEKINFTTLCLSCEQSFPEEEFNVVVEDELYVKGNHSELKRVCENLFRNSIEHGKSDVTITIGNLDEREGFYVEDDGKGINDDIKEKIFEPKFSTSNSTGLGMTIISNIVTNHGWEIEVTDSSSGGTRFEFTNVEMLNNEDTE